MGSILSYHTSQQSWYPLPENSLPLSDLTFPVRIENKSEPLTMCQKREMREWASLNGQVVRQRSGRQETTMARAGTLPENAYHQELVPITSGNQTAKSAKYVDRPAIDAANEVRDSDGESDNDTGDEEIRYSSDESESESDEECETTSLPKEITFAVGSVSRYGRAVKVNQKHFC